VLRLVRGFAPQGGVRPVRVGRFQRIRCGCIGTFYKIAGAALAFGLLLQGSPCKAFKNF